MSKQHRLPRSLAAAAVVSVMSLGVVACDDDDGDDDLDDIEQDVEDNVDDVEDEIDEELNEDDG